MLMTHRAVVTFLPTDNLGTYRVKGVWVALTLTDLGLQSGGLWGWGDEEKHGGGVTGLEVIGMKKKEC